MPVCVQMREALCAANGEKEEWTVKNESVKHIHRLALRYVISTLRAISLAAQCIVIGPVCLCVGVFVCGSVTTITRNCVHVQRGLGY